MPGYDRRSIAKALLERLNESMLTEGRCQFDASTRTRWFAVDDLLPEPGGAAATLIAQVSQAQHTDTAAGEVDAAALHFTGAS
jgi:hypothetical protein